MYFSVLSNIISVLFGRLAVCSVCGYFCLFALHPSTGGRRQTVVMALPELHRYFLLSARMAKQGSSDRLYFFYIILESLLHRKYVGFFVFFFFQASVNYGRVGDRVVVLTKQSGRRHHEKPAIVISKVRKLNDNKALGSLQTTDKIKYMD